MSVARRKGAAKAVVEKHAGVRSCGRIVKIGPVSLVSSGGALVTVQLVIDEEDIDYELMKAGK